MANSEPSHSPGPDSDPLCPLTPTLCRWGGRRAAEPRSADSRLAGLLPNPLSLSSEDEPVLTAPGGPRARAQVAAREPALALLEGDT